MFFLVCFSVISRSSFENVKTKWIPEIKHHVPEATFLLVGTKMDLRNDQEVLKKVSQPITKEEGAALAKELGARNYVECSALTQDGLKNVLLPVSISQEYSQDCPDYQLQST